MAAALVLLAVVTVTLCAPLYADHIAHTDPFQSHVSGTTVVGEKPCRC